MGTAWVQSTRRRRQAAGAPLLAPLPPRRRLPRLPADGHSYERRAAEVWLQGNSCSPLTGEALDASVCRPNHALRQLLEELT